MQTILLDVLREQWLSTKEANIYMTSLSLGRASVGTIARKSGENRVTTYSVINTLVQKWYINEIQKNKVKYYTAIHPNLLEKKAEEKLEKLKKYLPELALLDINSAQNKAKVEIFEWLDGLIRMCDEFYAQTEYIHVFLGADTMDPWFKDYMDNVFIPRRIRAGIPIDVISSGTQANQFYVDTAKTSVRRVVSIDEPFFELSGELFMYAPGRMALCLYSSDELLWIKIDSDHLYKSLYSIFQLIWKLKTWGVYKTLQQ